MLDIDECLNETANICQQICQNTAGGYQCGCTLGYVLTIDDVTCERKCK